MVLTLIFATYANIRTSKRSSGTHVFAFNAFQTLPYRPPTFFVINHTAIIQHHKKLWGFLDQRVNVKKCGGTLNFGTVLSPGIFSAQNNSTSELLRFL